MEKNAKIGMMRSRIEFFYNEYRLKAMESLSHGRYYRYYAFDDFAEFSMQNFVIIDYCFYLGEFCKTNRKWLANYESWRRYKYADEIKRRMYCLMKSLLFEVELAHPEKGRKIMEEIYGRLDERWYVSTDEKEKKMKNGQKFLIYAFMAGLMDVNEEEIDDYWHSQDVLMEEAERENEEFWQSRYNSGWDDYTIEDSISDALGGNLDAYWNID